MMPQTRRQARRILGLFETSHLWTITTMAACALVAWAAALWPEHEGLSDGGRWALFILVLSAGLWVTEAIPAVAVSLLAIGLEIAILGRPGGVFATGPKDWEMFIEPWGSSLIWLFFGGFCLAAAAEKTGLDRWLALRAVGFFGDKPAMLLVGVMSITAVLSMFMSNTATATLMVAVFGPLIVSRPVDDRFVKALLLAIAFGANVGGMGTVIGTPPNAIAAGVLSEAVGSGAMPPEHGVDFAQWMILAVPPAALILVLSWGYLTAAYLGGAAFKPVENLSFGGGKPPAVPPLRQVIVVGTFVATIGMWITSPWHGIPTTVVSFIPICVLTSTGVLLGDDLRTLSWDILLMIAGGLSLGVAIAETGLADWLVAQLPLEGLSPMAMVLGFGFLTVVLSNLMSNTATANIVLPLALAATTSIDGRLVVPIALCASLAMCLAISTPPNAIVYGAKRLTARDLLLAGLLTGLVGPPVAAFWCQFALRWV